VKSLGFDKFDGCHAAWVAAWSTASEAGTQTAWQWWFVTHQLPVNTIHTRDNYNNYNNDYNNDYNMAIVVCHAPTACKYHKHT